MENAEAPRPPDSGSTASSSVSQSSSSRQPGQRAASLATLGAVGAVTYLLFTGRLTAPWYGILSFYGAGIADLLPDEPAHPEAEIVRWCTAVLANLREHGSILRKSIGELEERPDAAVSMCEGPNCAGMLLTDYVLRLQSLGLADPDGDIPTAVAMLMSSMFGDAISRDVMPNAFPQPESEAPQKYVRVFMRALGVTPAVARRVSRRRSVAGD